MSWPLMLFVGLFAVLPLTVKCFALPPDVDLGQFSGPVEPDDGQLAAPFVALGQRHAWRPNAAAKHIDRSVYDPGDAKMRLSAFLADHRSEATDSVVGGLDAELLQHLREHIKEDEDIAVKSALLLKLLENYDSDEPMPVVYVEEPDTAEAALPFAGELDEDAAFGELPVRSADKRSGRFSHRYPYKRQNQRNRPYEPDQRYLCVPSRNDVMKLLIGLDEGRKGNHGRTVNFCNRKRPAKAIFSNIRFLG